MKWQHFFKFDFTFEKQETLLTFGFGIMPATWIAAKSEKIMNPVLKYWIDKTHWRFLVQFLGIDITQDEGFNSKGQIVLVTKIWKKGQLMSQKIWSTRASENIKEELRTHTIRAIASQQNQGGV